MLAACLLSRHYQGYYAHSRAQHCCTVAVAAAGPPDRTPYARAGRWLVTMAVVVLAAAVTTAAAAAVTATAVYGGSLLVVMVGGGR